MVLGRRQTFVSFGLVLAGVAAIATPAKAESCRPIMPDHPWLVSGYTFEARVEGIRAEGSDPTLTYVALAILKVYANPDSERLQEGRTIEVYSNPCDGFGLLGLTVGDEVLMSTRFLDEGGGPMLSFTAVWRAEAGNLRLLVLAPDLGAADGGAWRTNDRRIEEADTIQEALALVAPGAVADPNPAAGSTSVRGGSARASAGARHRCRGSPDGLRPVARTGDPGPPGQGARAVDSLLEYFRCGGRCSSRGPVAHDSPARYTPRSAPLIAWGVSVRPTSDRRPQTDPIKGDRTPWVFRSDASRTPERASAAPTSH